jgi:hypothetical protein
MHAGNRSGSERGECPRCAGSTVDLLTGSTCHYCGHGGPHTTEYDWQPNSRGPPRPVRASAVAGPGSRELWTIGYL